MRSCCSNLVVIYVVTPFWMVGVVRMLLLRLAGIGVADGGFLLLALAPRLLVDLFDGAQFLLEFHASVLEPDFDLTFCQTEGVRDFNPPPPCQVVVEVELFLQLQRLVARVSLSASSSWTPIGSFKIKSKYSIQFNIYSLSLSLSLSLSIYIYIYIYLYHLFNNQFISSTEKGIGDRARAQEAIKKRRRF